MPELNSDDDKIKNWVIGTAGVCMGISVFFFALPFFYSRTVDEFAQWLQGVAGPLGFASLTLIAYTTYLQQHTNRLQQEQHKHSEDVEHALVCERLLETYQRLLDTVEVITVQQHAALPEYRKGSRAFALLKAEHDRRVATALREAARAIERERFIRKYRHGVGPFIDVMIALMLKARDLRDVARMDAINRRTLAVVPFIDREVLVLFCPLDHVDALKSWLKL